jgi:hypothetical protein
MRRFTRRTNAFSRKVQKHEAMVAIYPLHYHFAKIHHRLTSTRIKNGSGSWSN